MKTKFNILNFFRRKKDTKKYKHIKRCNPIDPRYINNREDAYEIANKICKFIVPSYVDELTRDVVICVLAAAIRTLRFKKEGRFCTIPHVIELFKNDIHEVIPICEYPMSLLNENDNSKALYHTIRIYLENSISESNYWLLTGNDFKENIQPAKYPWLEDPIFPFIDSVKTCQIIDNLYKDRKFQPYVIQDKLCKLMHTPEFEKKEKENIEQIKEDIQTLLKETVLEKKEEEMTNENKNTNNKEKTYVDLGLPSGILWSTCNEEEYYSCRDARKKFPKSLPTKTDFKELQDNCSLEWDNKEKGVLITGPNGNSIFLPASGYCNDIDALVEFGKIGDYWSATDGEFYTYYFRVDYSSRVISINKGTSGCGRNCVRCIQRLD